MTAKSHDGNVPPKRPIPWSAALGDIAEDKISSLLGYFASASKYRRDVGLDFYCELREDEAPGPPFYVQAKGTEHFDEKWGASISTSTIMYWLQKESPVFLVVYDERNRECYWLCIEDRRYELIYKLFKSDAKTVYVTLDRSCSLAEGKDANPEFVAKIREAQASIDLFRGHARLVGDKYVKTHVGPPRSQAELDRIKETVRCNLVSLVYHHMDMGDAQTAAFYCAFLSHFDKDHYEHFWLLGRNAGALGHADAAREAYENAIKLLEADPEWPDADRQQKITKIRQEIAG